MKINKKIVLAIFTPALLAITGYVVLTGVEKTARWFDSNTLEVRSPIRIETQKVIVVTEREKLRPIVELQKDDKKVVAKAKDRDLAEYICSKDWNCEVALAVAMAESGMRADSLNLNGGHSLDVGIFQINVKYHGKKQGCSLAELADKYKNVDCAYSIWKQQGWNPWVAYTNGMYLAHIK